MPVTREEKIGFIQRIIEVLYAFVERDGEELVTRPYTIKKKGNKYCVYKKGANGQATGKSLGCHDSKKKAVAQIGAIESNTEEERDIQAGRVYYMIEQQLAEMDYDYPWIVDYMHGSDGNYMVFTAGGKLYRADFSISTNDEVEVDQVREVKLDYPVIEESREKPVFRTFRDTDGKLKFLAIAASAVLNRVGQIDSTELFDDFEVELEKRDTPYLTLQHLPEFASFGAVEGVFRLNSLLAIYGVIDEGTILGRSAEKRFASGEWGISIGFKPTERPAMETIGGVEIPIYKRGYLVEASVLKEDRAASYFTMISSVDREIRKMGVTKEAAKETMLEFAGDEAEDEIDAFLEEMDIRQRKIEDEGLITRDAEEESEEEAEEENEEENTEETTEETTEEVASEENSTESPDDEVDVYEVSDDLVEQLVEMVMDRIRPAIDDVVALVNRTNDELRQEINGVKDTVTRINEFVSESKEQFGVVGQRLNAVEQEEGKKVRDALEDIPATKKRQVVVTHRPTEKEDGDGDGEGGIDLTKLSEQTLRNQGVELERYKNPDSQ